MKENENLTEMIFNKDMLREIFQTCICEKMKKEFYDDDAEFVIEEVPKKHIDNIGNDAKYMLHVLVEGKEVRWYLYEDEHETAVRINYCPFCGTPLC